MKLFAYSMVTASVLAAGTAQAQIFPTDPDLILTDSLAVTSGSFEWDNFFGSAFASQSPDVVSTGTGTADLTLTFEAQPFDGPPVPLVTSTSNLYAGGTLVDFTAGVDGAESSEAYTTVVAQISTLGTAFDDFLLNGLAPTEFVDRGTQADVEHGEFSAPFDTNYYWVEWQLSGSDVVSTLDFTFGNTVTHQSLTQVRIDYVNSSSVVDAASPTLVPEPASLFVLGLGGLLMQRRRRQTA
ncbi:MAG: PEP-CTERM sorting domain-containing protein [Planctomycetota bacterium]